MRAFWELSSCRSFGGGAIGPIPWNRIIEYGERKGLDNSLIEVMEVVMREMDEAYIRDQLDEQERRGQRNRKKK